MPEITEEEIASAPPAKISQYKVMRNTAEYYTWSIEPRVVSRDVNKLAWMVEDDKVEVSIEDNGRYGSCLMLRGPQKAEHETLTAFLQLPKKCQPIIADIDQPERGGLFVTVLKQGAPAGLKPPPLDDMLTGRAKRRIIGPDGLVCDLASDIPHRICWRAPALMATLPSLFCVMFLHMCLSTCPSPVSRTCRHPRADCPASLTATRSPACSMLRAPRNPSC